MGKIKQITVVTYQGVGITEVGRDGVAEIKEESQEYQHGIDYIFKAYDENGKLLKEIINCPVEITYA